MSRPIRSMLFVPGDSERKMAKALATNADALVLDLEDSVALPRKADARRQVAEFLGTASFKGELWVRVNPLTTTFCLEDLAVVARARPAGILLPKCVGPQDVAKVSHYLDVLEVREGINANSTKILAVTTETAQAPFSLGHYAEAELDRLMGLTWGAEDLSSALGAAGNKDEFGNWTLTYQMVRSLCLLAAKACEVQAIETLYVDFKDPDGLAKSCRASRREGFTGRFAIHPDQVDPINEGYMPDSKDVEHARRVITAFMETDSGTVALDGQMLDIPHLNQAKAVLALHESYASYP
jgi:citrate lyase subunit beta / citryl-CoA lyase